MNNFFLTFSSAGWNMFYNNKNVIFMKSAGSGGAMIMPSPREQAEIDAYFARLKAETDRRAEKQAWWKRHPILNALRSVLSTIWDLLQGLLVIALVLLAVLAVMLFILFILSISDGPTAWDKVKGAY